MKSILLFLGLGLFTTPLFSQSLNIPCSLAPTLDGTIDSVEWARSDTAIISIMNGNNTVDVLVQHDNVSLFIAFMGNLQSTIRFPEVLIDVNNDKSQSWAAEDAWFHVSATDCESFGLPSNYDSCQLVRPNWTAIPNMIAGGPTVDTIEIEIPFSTIGIQTGDTIGLAFDVTNTATFWEYWPSGASINNPSTWGTAILSNCDPIGRDEYENFPFSLFPNPAKEFIHLEFRSKENPSSVFNVEIIDAIGRSVKQWKSTSINENGKIYVGDLDSGAYYVSIKTDDGQFHTKLIID